MGLFINGNKEIIILKLLQKPLNYSIVIEKLEKLISQAHNFYESLQFLLDIDLFDFTNLAESCRVNKNWRETHGLCEEQLLKSSALSTSQFKTLSISTMSFSEKNDTLLLNHRCLKWP